MIKPDMTHVKNLEEFYEEIKSQQAGAHGEEYIQHHKAIIKCAKECETIKEIGVCQGGTFAAMMLQHPKKLIGMDIMPKYFTPYQHLFDAYAEENNLDYEYIEGNSHDHRLIHKVDMLHIDSLHKPDHLLQELRIHARHVSKYIVFHDTANFKGSRGLLPVIAKYITEEDQTWTIVDHYIQRVGYTVIKKTQRKEHIDNTK